MIHRLEDLIVRKTTWRVHFSSGLTLQRAVGTYVPKKLFLTLTGWVLYSSIVLSDNAGLPAFYVHAGDNAGLPVKRLSDADH